MESSCSVETQKHLHILDRILFAIFLISISIFALSIYSMIKIENNPDSGFLFTTIIPPYMGISSGVIAILDLIAIASGKYLRKKICPKDGVSYTLFD